jgi:hypothetical protein
VTFVLDSGIVSRLCHPAKKQYRPVSRWIQQLLERPGQTTRIILPEIGDYEVRRKLIQLIRKQQASPKSLERLDALVQTLSYLPLRTSTLRRAAELWASARIERPSVASERAAECPKLISITFGHRFGHKQTNVRLAIWVLQARTSLISTGGMTWTTKPTTSS